MANNSSKKEDNKKNKENEKDKAIANNNNEASCSNTQPGDEKYEALFKMVAELASSHCSVKQMDEKLKDNDDAGNMVRNQEKENRNIHQMSDSDESLLHEDVSSGEENMEFDLNAFDSLITNDEESR